MTPNELKQKFTDHGKTARDFIRWAKQFGVVVYDATVSKHINGLQGITGPWVIAYTWFFLTCKDSPQKE